MDTVNQQPQSAMVTVNQQVQSEMDSVDQQAQSEMVTVNPQPQINRKRLQLREWRDEFRFTRSRSALESIRKYHEEVEKEKAALAKKNRYHFLPSDMKLVQTYLMKYLKGDVIPLRDQFVEEDFYSYSPYTIHATFEKGQYHRLWYFFARKHEEHEEPIRVVPCGYWKQVGESQVIVCDDSTVGYKKRFLFYKGDTERGKRTFWQLAEYSIVYEDIIRSTPGTSNSAANDNTKVYDKVLCRLIAQA